MDYLGHIISPQGVSADPDKINSIISSMTPQTIKELRGFLGLTGYYRKFVRNYGSIAQPLTQLLKKNAFSWLEPAEKAFQQLKEVMAAPPVFAMLDFTQPFVIETDASGVIVGAVLRQQGYPLAYMSYALKGRQLAWSTYEKEMHAIILAVAKWRPYLLGGKFTIRTDHIGLKNLIEQRIHTNAQQKWLLKLLGYEFEIEYKVGASNKVADTLSRKDMDSAVQSCMISFPTPAWLEIVQEMYKGCEDLKILKEKWVKGKLDQIKFQEKNGLLFRKGKIVLSSQHDFRHLILKEFHDAPTGGHLGYEKTLHKIHGCFWWKGLRGEVKQYIWECHICQSCKYEHCPPPGLL